MINLLENSEKIRKHKIRLHHDLKKCRVSWQKNSRRVYWPHWPHFRRVYWPNWPHFRGVYFFPFFFLGTAPVCCCWGCSAAGPCKEAIIKLLILHKKTDCKWLFMCDSNHYPIKLCLIINDGDLLIFLTDIGMPACTVYSVHCSNIRTKCAGHYTVLTIQNLLVFSNLKILNSAYIIV